MTETPPVVVQAYTSLVRKFLTQQVSFGYGDSLSPLVQSAQSLAESFIKFEGYTYAHVSSLSKAPKIQRQYQPSNLNVQLQTFHQPQIPAAGRAPSSVISQFISPIAPLTAGNIEANSRALKRNPYSLDEDCSRSKRPRMAETSVFGQVSDGTRESRKDEEINALRQEMKKAFKKIESLEDEATEYKAQNKKLHKVVESVIGLDSVQVRMAMAYLDNDIEPEDAVTGQGETLFVELSSNIDFSHT